jgi:hypothetical protein
LGQATLAFIKDITWLDRRVETVRFVDSNTLERHVTLDINCDRVREIVTKAGWEPDKEIPLPLTLLSKGLLLDVDVRSADGAALPISTSDIDARAAQAALLACLANSGEDVTAYSRAIWQTILSAVKSFPSEADRFTLQNPSQAADAVEAWELAQDLSGDPGDREVWAALLDHNEEFWSLLVNLTLGFMLMTPVKVSTGTKIIKYRYIERQEPSELRWWERLGFRNYTPLLVQASAVGTARREHLRLEAPDGMCLDSAYLWHVRGGLGPGGLA